jgi:hypothetical protein
MYVPSILHLPLHSTGPIIPGAPTEALTSDWPLLDDGQVQIGVWECTPGTFGSSTGDFDESMYMVAGRASIDHEEGRYDLAPGTLWVTPRRWANRWTVHQTVRKLYVIDNRPGGGAVAAHLANAHTLELGEGSPRPVVLAGAPVEASVSIWEHNGLDVGVWECTPGEFPFRRDGYDEVFCVLAGRATLHIDAASGPGQAFELTAGSVILTPAGLTGRWVVHETLRKAYTIVMRPASA